LKLLRLAFWAGFTALAVIAQGCAAGGSNGSGSAGSGGGGAGTAGSTGTAGTSGAAGNTGTSGTTGTAGSGAGTAGSSGASGAAGSSGTSGAGGSATGTAGSSGASGATGSAGTGGSAGSAGTAGRGGSAGGAAGRGGATGTAGAGGTTGTGGAGGSTTPHGSAAKFICPQGQTYGNPLTGMGAINQITAPTMPSGQYFAFIEGPIWIGGLATVFFSDNAFNPEQIWKVSPPSTTAAVFIPGSGSNGLAVDNSDRIVAADERNKRITTFDPMTGQIVGTPISTGAAKPNDVIVRSDNNIYFTDPATGFYRIAPGSSTVSAAMKLPNNGGQPNGIELSLDENTLYVGDVAQQKIFKYTLAADGTVMGTGTELVSQTMRTTVDGMCVDCAGNIYAGTQGAVEVYSSAGTYIGSIVTSLQTSNCTFGGADRKTLYMTTPSALKYVTLAVPGLPD
jgi:sugar lactone lactonase YvrE